MSEERAFPTEGKEGFTENHDDSAPYWPGMSLHDWYVGQALIGMLAGTYDMKRNERVFSAFEIADTIMHIRERRRVEGE